MIVIDLYQLWKVNSVVYTIEDAGVVIDGTNNLIARCIPRKKRELRKEASVALKKLESKGIEGAIRTELLKPYRAAGYPLFELRIYTTSWRMFSFKHEGNEYIVIFDVFESHKDKNNNRTTERARDKRSREKFELAIELCKRTFGDV